MNDTRTEIIAIAERLIRTKGYDGFSYKDIASVLDIKNAAIHYYFPSKADLGTAVIQRNRDSFRQLVKQTDKNLDATGKLNRFIEIYTKSHQQGLVCFMGALGPAFDHLPPQMQLELTLASHEIRSWVKAILEEGKQTKQFTFQGSAQSQADAIIASLLASLVLNKVIGEDVLAGTIEQITQNI